MHAEQDPALDGREAQTERTGRARPTGPDCQSARSCARITRAMAATMAPFIAAALLLPGPARAVDGCLVLLCLAAPSWRAIPACVPPIHQLMRDLARGKAFPHCAMAGPGNGARHTWASAPGHCPPQYTRVFHGPNDLEYACDYSGAIAITVEGRPFTTTWWGPAGDTVTEFSEAAKARLGHWDTRFEDDFARWLTAQPVPGQPLP